MHRELLTIQLCIEKAKQFVLGNLNNNMLLQAVSFQTVKFIQKIFITFQYMVNSVSNIEIEISKEENLQKRRSFLLKRALKIDFEISICLAWLEVIKCRPQGGGED